MTAEPIGEVRATRSAPQANATTSRQPYTRPTCAELGSLRQLTSGGSGSATEGTNDTSTTKSPMA